MPYEGELASYRSLQRIAQNTRVTELLGRFHVREWSASAAITTKPIELTDLEPSQWTPDWVLAVDGSHAEIPVRYGFPGAEAAYVTVASVLLNLGKIRQLDGQRPVDPRKFRTTHQAESIDCALPGCNIVLDRDDSAATSLRRVVFEVFRSTQMTEDGETLLDTYEALLARKPTAAREQKCPYEDCRRDGSEFLRDYGAYQCPCTLGRSLFSTDALRFAEGMNLGGPNGAMFAEIMQVFERVWVIHVLRTLEKNNWLRVLKRLAIVLDGPLAVFGHPAWLSQAIADELERINGKVRESNDGQDLIVLGVEKAGAFVEHFVLLDKGATGAPGKFPKQAALLLSDAYIKQNIIPSESTKPYGADTYFGRKFLYKTLSGALIVPTLPFLRTEDRDTRSALPEQYPRLVDAMRMLDMLVSSRYPNAITPIVAAHAEAAIPLNLGRKVLESLAKELMAGQ